MKRKEELKGLLSTAEHCVETDNEEGLEKVLENIQSVLNESEKLKKGDRIKIERHGVKADNGTFEITSIIDMPQNENVEYIWQRVSKRTGKKLKSKKARNCRGMKDYQVQELKEKGVLKRL